MLGAIVLIALSVWAIDTRGTLQGLLESSDRAAAARFQAALPESRIAKGLVVMTLHPQFWTVMAGVFAAIAAAIASVVFILKRHRWPYLVAIAGCIAGIVVAWMGRAEVWDIEASAARSAKWAAKSQWVQAATTLAIAGTVVFALLAICALVALLTAPKTRAAAPAAAAAPTSSAA